MRRWKGMFVDIGVAGAFIGLVGMVFLLQSIPRATQPETVTAETQETVQQAEKTVSVRVKETEDPSPIDQLSKKERYLLEKLVMAEAEGEPLTSQACVVWVVLNRMASDEFPNTLEGVIYQPGQFEVMENGRFWDVEPSDDAKVAVHLVSTGWNESKGATYFDSPSESTWHEDTLTFLFKKGNLSFYAEN